MAVRSVRRKLWRWAPGAFAYGFARSLALFGGSGYAAPIMPAMSAKVPVRSLAELSSNSSVAFVSLDAPVVAASVGQPLAAYTMNNEYERLAA